MRVVFLSIAAHAVAFAFVMRTPTRAHVPAPSAETPIEVVEEEPPPPPVPSSEESLSTGAVAIARAPSTAPRAIAVVTSNEGSFSLPSSEAPAPAPTWSGSFFSVSPKQMGIAENPFLPSGPPKEEQDKKRKPDLGLRFGPSSEGPALAVFKDVTSRSLAPLEGRARFTVRANADGEVLGIDLDDSTGGPGWDDAKRLALDELRGKRFVVPRGARGINVRFEVASEVSYPSGQRTKHEFAIRDGALVLPDESNIGQVRTRKIHTRHLGTEVL